MKSIRKIAALLLALGMGLAVFAGCGGGSSWLYGEGAPAAELGSDGARYLDTASWDIYLKEDGVWTVQGNAQGAAGSGGTEGAKGNGWLYGEGVPAAELGRDGDSYLDLQTWDVYGKDGEKWTFRNNINGNSDYYKDFFRSFEMTEGKVKVFGRSEDPSENFFMTSVQGLFAQVGEAKYYADICCLGSFLTELTAVYGKETEPTDIEAMCADYADRFSGGYVLFDAASAESTNCARTVAGAERLAMVSTDLQSWARARGLYEVVDATEMTAKACFDRYKDRLNREGLVYGDVMTSDPEDPNDVTIVGSNVGLTDYVIACKYFCYYPADAKQQGTEDDRWAALREEVHDWCEGAPIFGGFPMGEVESVRTASRHDSPIIAGVPYNLSLYGCKDFFGETEFKQKNRPEPITEKKYPLDKHYVTVVCSDGDNLGATFDYFYEGKGSMKAPRGDFPMGWEINPSLYGIAPNVLRHYYNSAEAGDSYVCSISGFGHTFARYVDDRTLARLTSKVDGYIGACDLPVVKLLDDGSMFDAAEDRALDAYTKMKNAEGFLYCTFGGAYKEDHGSVRWFNEKPVVSCRYSLWGGVDDAESIAAAVNASPTDATKIESYSYVNLNLWTKNYDPDVKAMVAAFDEDVIVVDPLTFLRLIGERVEHRDVVLSA